MPSCLRSTLATLVGLSLLAPVSALAQGGPDAGGHIWNTTTYDFVVLDPNAGGSGTALPITTNDQEHDVTLPWALPFYGNSYTEITVGETGTIAMGFGANLFNGNNSLPYTGGSSPDIAVHWDSIDAYDSGGVAFGGIYTFDDSANNRFIVSWEDVEHDNTSSGTGSFQVHLFSDGTMSFHYKDTDFDSTSYEAGASATIGIQDFTNGTAASGNALEISYNTPVIVDGVTAFAITFCADGDADGEYDSACGGLDCNDADAAINTSGTEVCNDTIDQDCSGADSVDDFDADGFVNDECGGDDCDDLDAAVNTAAAEACDDGVDNDCDASTIDLFDVDGDGFDCTDDCDDSNAAVNPSEAELCADGLDNDCDGVPLLSDQDGDGFINIECGGDDCEDSDPALNNATDADGDGVTSCDDCDDNNPAAFPGGTEVCDGADNDCDGMYVAAATAYLGDTATSIFSGSDRGRGGKFTATANATLNTLGATLDVDAGQSINWVIYERAAGATDYTQTWSGLSTSPADGQMNHWAHLGAGYAVTAGNDYLFTYWWTDSIIYLYTSPSDLPVAGAYGTYSNGFAASGVAPSTVTADPTTTTQYSLIINLGDEFADSDADGVTACAGDCDDTTADALPGGTEVCDGLDNDCDTNIDDVDGDADGEVSADCGGADCNDADATINSAAVELCDGIDGDCDGIDDGSDTDLGSPPAPNAAETQASTPGSVITNNNPTTYEVLTFTTAGTVTDVNVTVDISHSWDSDLDIFLVSPSGTSVELSTDNGGSSSAGYVGTTFDDAATDPITSGSAPFTGSFQPEGSLADFNGESMAGTWTLEVTDDGGGDDGTLDALSITIESLSPGADGDLDGFIDQALCAGYGADCDDANASVYPGAPLDCTDAIDQDCDGVVEPNDVDGDGGASLECGGSDCDDTDAGVFDGSDFDTDGALGCQDDCNDLDINVNPTAVEVCSDGIDNDCDGVSLEGLDVDGDGETDCTDCDDNDAAVNSTAIEDCTDGIDNDCSGAADDEDLDADGGISGDCGGDDCDDADANAYVGNTEACDGVDNDCDGLGDDQDLDLAPAPLSETGTSAPGTVIDSSLPIVEDIITVALVDTVGDVDVTVDITHTWDGDLDIFLISPAGTRVELSTDNGSLNDDYTGTTFDDSALTSITAGSAPFTGSFQPEGSLASVNGEATNGDWTLEITDDTGGDVGTLNSWSITVSAPLAGDIDNDLDGYLNVLVCTAVPGDCDDADATVNPGATDICGDGIDQDCDGADAGGDVDGDGFTGVGCGGDDCDDTDPAVNPGVLEVCNDTLDNDCDASTDDLADGDGDGSDCSVDCDDTNALAYPGFPFDICNDGADNDCDPTTADIGDFDGDGDDCLTDCDDSNPVFGPSQPELLCTGLDEDCDPTNTPDVADGDGDGFNCDVDCLDTNAAVNPAAVEVACDAIDNDCDGTLDEPDVDGDGVTCGFDCNDNDPTAFPGNPEVCNDTVDNDCDPTTVDNFDNDADGVTCITDCDDNDPLTNPGAPEICGDGVDQDCDSSVDEPVNDSYALIDDDSVLIGLCNFSFSFCGTDWDEVYVGSNGRLTFGFDNVEHTESSAAFLAQSPNISASWNDLDPAVGGSISIEEVADTGAGASLVVSWDSVPELGVSGSANTFALTLYDDGTANVGYNGLTMTDGLVGFACGDGSTGQVVATDLSDYEMLPNAWAIGMGSEDAVYEQFNDQGNTHDLDGTVLDFCLTAGDDLDGDGWTDVCGDCDDADATTFPGAVEICGDGGDNDCNGSADDADGDEDGEVDLACGGVDCDDADELINTSAAEVCDGIDNDCDGAVEDGGADDDADGWLVCGGDCDDTDAAINPDAAEVCDQVDNDCDGADDNGFTSDADNDGVIAEDCAGTDCDDTNDAVYPGATEICDLADNDCNGETDEIDADADGYIDANCGGDDCNDTNAAVNPGAEEVPYDGLDNDCLDGDLVDGDGDGYFGGEEGGDCDDGDANVHPAAEENCEDGIDNNCDGGIDKGDKDTDTPADVTCNTGCSCASSVVDADSAPSTLAMLLGLMGLAGIRRRRVA